ncbi:hypothetical protein CNYM01_14143 [Colletotrichum nymphaeae SA-01]|uniref:Chromo domain-containing protein n=1 Tax=Colletotrichum nymphaeae SA-01 TaxID=1460502 RepID=A0A135UHZ0_9PEZI|nr:hypothetical protein CNYM01_14143 [Colletotrichum nymphaeae SA-01]
MASVKYVRRSRISRSSSCRLSKPVAPSQRTAVRTSNRLGGPTRSNFGIGKNTVSGAATSSRVSTTIEVQRSRDFLDSDDLVGWRRNPSTKNVDILTCRHADGSKRLVPERLIQQRSPLQLYAYWQTFSRPREETIDTNHYHIFDIIDDDASRGYKVQWVGYSPSDSDTTWEQPSKVGKIAPKLLDGYIMRRQACDASVSTRKCTGPSKS